MPRKSPQAKPQTEPPPPPPPPAPPVDAAQPTAPEAGFWDRIATLSESEWQSHVIYLYRLLPKVDLASDRNFIAKYQRSVDEQDILTDHGSGKYLAILNNTKARKTVEKTTFSVYSDKQPPRVRASQIVACPENEPWMSWAKGAKRD